MSLQPPTTREDGESDVGIPSGVIAQAEAIAASNATRDDSSIVHDEVSASGNGQTRVADNSIPDLHSGELGRIEHR